MPANRPYTASAYQAQLKKLEAKVSRASTPMARRKAQKTIRDFKKTRSKYYTGKNPADKAVRKIASQVKAKAKPGIKKIKKAVSAVKKRSQRVSDSGPTQKRRLVQKLTKQLSSMMLHERMSAKGKALKKKLAGVKSEPASVFAIYQRAESPTKKVAKKKVAKKKVAKKRGNSAVPTSPQVKRALRDSRLSTRSPSAKKKVAKKKGNSRIPISPQVKSALAKQKLSTMLGKKKKKVAKKKVVPQSPTYFKRHLSR